MLADLFELLVGELPRFRQNVLGHGELADVVKERGRLDALDFLIRQAKRLGEARGIELNPPDVVVRVLILGINRARQRLDGRQ